MSLTAHFVPASNVGAQQVIYFWMMDTNIADKTPLSSLNATFALNPQAKATLNYTPSTTKSTMERIDSPTSLNYIQEVNGNLPFLSSNMKGIQIKQPFQSGSLQNTMIFNIPT